MNVPAFPKPKALPQKVTLKKMAFLLLLITTVFYSVNLFILKQNKDVISYVSELYLEKIPSPPLGLKEALQYYADKSILTYTAEQHTDHLRLQYQLLYLVGLEEIKNTSDDEHKRNAQDALEYVDEMINDQIDKTNSLLLSLGANPVKNIFKHFAFVLLISQILYLSYFGLNRLNRYNQKDDSLTKKLSTVCYLCSGQLVQIYLLIIIIRSFMVNFGVI